jgi:hypothetical protein
MGLLAAARLSSCLCQPRSRPLYRRPRTRREDREANPKGDDWTKVVAGRGEEIVGQARLAWAASVPAALRQVTGEAEREDDTRSVK